MQAHYNGIKACSCFRKLGYVHVFHRRCNKQKKNKINKNVKQKNKITAVNRIKVSNCTDKICKSKAKTH